MNADIFLDAYGNPKVCLDLKLHEKTRIECFIDTGFSGGLLLPQYYFSLTTDLKPVTTDDFVLADGTKVTLDTYRTKVKYEKRLYEVSLIFANGSAPLVGIEFLQHFSLFIDIKKQQISLKKTA